MTTYRPLIVNAAANQIQELGTSDTLSVPNLIVTGTITGTASSVTNGVFTTNFTGTNQSLGTNGWQKMPGGLIMQWGYFENFAPRLDRKIVLFPIAFPNACFNVQITQRKPDDDGFNNVSGIDVLPTTTQVTFTVRDDVDTSHYWMAMGY